LSRITRTRIQPGDPLTSGDLNDRFTDYNQPGALNQFNVRDGAFDLPHLATNLIVRDMKARTIGTGDWTRNTVNTVTSQSAAGTAAVKFPVSDGGATPTDLGPFVWDVDAFDVVRVYWSLNVEPKYQGTPWSGSPAELTFAGTGGSTTVASIGGHCWVISLEWDITNATLTNFVPVFGGTNFITNVGGFIGGSLEGCRHASVVPAWRLSSLNADDGQFATPRADKTGWYGASGCFYYAPTTPGVTIYGFRVVIHGVYHPAQATGGENYLLVDDTVGGGNTVLDYSTGSLSAIWQRTR
jgi:hypothetical protein